MLISTWGNPQPAIHARRKIKRKEQIITSWHASYMFRHHADINEKNTNCPKLLEITSQLGVSVSHQQVFKISQSTTWKVLKWMSNPKKGVKFETDFPNVTVTVFQTNNKPFKPNFYITHCVSSMDSWPWVKWVMNKIFLLGISMRYLNNIAVKRQEITATESFPSGFRYQSSRKTISRQTELHCNRD